MTRGRANAYALLARLVLQGAQPELLAQARSTPGLAEVFGDAVDDDALAAGHYELFGLLAPPYAAAYLEGEATLDAIRRDFAAAGFTPLESEVTSDHLGIALAFLSFAEHAIADAMEDGESQVAVRLAALVADFMDRWLLSWLPVWVVAAAARGGVWGELAKLIGAFVTSHRATLGQPVVAAAQAGRQPAVELLADPHTGLGAIAAWLVAPHQAGIWLSRADIVDVARRCGAPAGFGPRRQLLENLLSSAASYGELPEVARELMRLWQERDRALGDSGVEPALLSGWRAAAAEAGWLLGRMGQEAERARPLGEPAQAELFDAH